MKIKSFLQKLRIKLGKFFLDSKSSVKINHNLNADIKRILFLRQDGKIGDYIVSSFVFRELKKQNPNLFIGVICTVDQVSLLEKNKYIDKLYLVRKRNFIDYIKVGLSIKREKYDAVVDPTVFVRNRDLMLLRLINAKYYVGYRKENYNIFNLNLEGEYHFSKLYELAINKLGFHITDNAYDVPYDLGSQKEIAQFLIENNINNYITVNFYGAAKIKKVNDENIVKYLDYLTAIFKDNAIILLSYPQVTEKLKSLAKPYKKVFVHNTHSIFDTIELIRHCELIITTDTSTVHIASGLNKKIIAIYKEDKTAFLNWSPKSNNETHILFYKENINEIMPNNIKPEWLK